MGLRKVTVLPWDADVYLCKERMVYHLDGCEYLEAFDDIEKLSREEAESRTDEVGGTIPCVDCIGTSVRPEPHSRDDD